MNIKGLNDGFAIALTLLGAVLLITKITGQSRPAVERYGMIIGLKPEKIAYYKELHAATWPGVLKMIRECNIRNYSIYFKEVEPEIEKMRQRPFTERSWQSTHPAFEMMTNEAREKLAQDPDWYAKARGG